MTDLLVLLAVFVGLGLLVLALVVIVPPILYFARWWLNKWDNSW